VRDVVRHGLTWGLGHTITLFAFAGAALVLRQAIPKGMESALETAVGVMLVGLGLNVFWRMWRERVHFHAHSHGDGTTHFHAHSHAGETAPHRRAVHAHEHRGFRWRTLAVGLMHGMAGSAALLVLAATQLSTPLEGLVYVLVFGLGSMIGMGLLSTVIAVPFVLSARFLTQANGWLQGSIGAATLTLGLMTVLKAPVFA
jgi:ABC-type nickel/cobalt efflux system permease component RcnA